MDPMTVLKGVCLATGAAMHVSGIPTMREIQAARSTLNYHIAPYASGFLNQSVNLWYACIRGDVPLMVHRCAGVAANTYYLSTYLMHSAPGKAADNRVWLVRVGTLLGGLFVYLHVVLPLAGLYSLYNSQIALAGAITGVGLAAAPLATVREVLRTKDASSFPGPLVLMQFLQFLSWTIYGWLRDDWSTFANNAVGVVLGGFTLFLIAIYGNKRSANGAGGGAAGGGGGAGASGGVIAGSGGAVVDAEAGGDAEVLQPLREREPGTSESKHR